MEISSGIFIHLLDLTRSSCEKCSYHPPWQESKLWPFSQLVRSNQCKKYSLEISIYKSLHKQLVLPSEMPQIVMFIHTPYIGITLVFIHELAVRVRQLSLCSSVG